MYNISYLLQNYFPSLKNLLWTTKLCILYGVVWNSKQLNEKNHKNNNKYCVYFLKNFCKTYANKLKKKPFLLYLSSEKSSKKTKTKKKLLKIQI